MIYMAAGNSRRFGSNKLFYPIDGKPMYRHVLERLAAICERHSDWEIVLVSQYEELLEQGRTFAHRTVFSPESRDGASWLREKTMEGFVCEMEKQHADLGSVCQGETPGNPVWFSRKYLPDLRALSGDQGGRKILKKHPEEIRWYPVAHAKELEDVDYNFDNNLIVPDGAC